MNIKQSNNFFENIYKNSQGNEEKIPWAEMKTNTYLTEYIEKHESKGKAIVIGCGLGDDALALEQAGYAVTAIDISVTAINWCKERYADSNITFKVQDIFELPDDMLEQYDFVFESRTIQSLPIPYRDKIIGAISTLMAPNAEILIIANGRRQGDNFDGPPWPLEAREMRLFEQYGCKALSFSTIEESGTLSRLKFCAVYQKM